MSERPRGAVAADARRLVCGGVCMEGLLLSLLLSCLDGRASDAADWRADPAVLWCEADICRCPAVVCAWFVWFVGRVAWLPPTLLAVLAVLDVVLGLRLLRWWCWLLADD